MKKEKSANSAFGAFLKERRTALNLTQSQVGEMIGKDSTTIAHYETGRRSVYLPTILLLEVALKFSFDDFKLRLARGDFN